MVTSTTRARRASRIGPIRSDGPFVEEDADGSALGVVELSGAQGPMKAKQAGETQAQRNRDEEGYAVHAAILRSRSALATTMIDEVDMAIAATSGVTSPASASGTARRL